MISEKIRTAQGMEGSRRATGIPYAGTAAQGAHFMPFHPPNPEVPEKATRRHFTAGKRRHRCEVNLLIIPKRGEKSVQVFDHNFW